MLDDDIRRWETIIGDKRYIFTCEKITRELEMKREITGKYLLTINGEEIVIKKKSTGIFEPLDEPFNFDGKEWRFVKTGKAIDIVYNERFVNSGKQYIATPEWLWIFIVLSFYLALFFASPFSLKILAIWVVTNFLSIFVFRKKIPKIIQEVGFLLITTQFINFLFIFNYSLDRILRNLQAGIITTILGFPIACACVSISRKNIPTSYRIIVCILIIFFSIVILFLGGGMLFSLGILS